MTSKHSSSPQFIPNPFVKKRNLQWTITSPTDGSVVQDGPTPEANGREVVEKPTLRTSHLESGEAHTEDPLSIFTTSVSSHTIDSQPHISVSTYTSYYTTNANSSAGAHFVIHQHDHPVAGTHYDLRLQINENSSVSWAIMYGLPGDPNSVRLNRNATETRVHCLWNHLIETASSETGSLLIWDTGTYSILPRQSKHTPEDDPSSPPASPAHSTLDTQQELLHAAFQTRKIRLQLHGHKLPHPYILNLRLTKSEDAQGRARSASSRPQKRRRRGRPAKAEVETSSDDDEDDEDDAHVVPRGKDVKGDVSAMEREIQEMEDDEMRRTNAYTGAVNSIGSVHQRRWYLSLDRAGCGFVRKKSRGRKDLWEQDPVSAIPTLEISGDACRLPFPFYVRGVEGERSIVTGRLGVDLLRDEGVSSFVQRKGWKPVLN